MNTWLAFLGAFGIGLLVIIFFDIVGAILDMILDPCETIDRIKNIGFWKTIKQYIKEANDPRKGNWWSF